MVDRLQRKKELVQSRDSLLEEIGWDAFRHGHLPDEFGNLAQEFQEMEQLKGQIEERIQPLGFEIERLVARQPPLEKQIKQLELKRKNEITPLVLELNEASAKLQATPGEGAEPLDEASRQQLSGRIQHINELLSQSKEQHQKQRGEWKAELDLLEKKAERLRSEIQKLKDEEEQLDQRKTSLIRDLGYHFFRNRLEESHYTARYGQIELVNQEIMDLQHQTLVLTQDAQPLPKRPLKRVVLPILGLVVAALAFLLFQTRYNSLDLDASQLLALLEPRLAGESFYLRGEMLTRHAAELASAQQLPGLAKESLSTENLSEFLLARPSAGEPPSHCALRFQRSAPDMKALLPTETWHSQALPSGLKAWSNGAQTWLQLAAGHLLLMPQSEAEAFAANPLPAKNPADFTLLAPLETLGSQYPLMAGARHLRMEGGAEKWMLRLDFAGEPLDLARRKQFLASRAQLPPAISAARFESTALLLEGTGLPLPGMDGSAQMNFLNQIRDSFASLPPASPDQPTFPEANPPAELPPRGPSHVLAFAMHEGPRLLAQAAIGLSIRDLCMDPLNKSIWLADGSAGVLRDIRFDGTAFFLFASIDFKREGQPTLQPSALALHPTRPLLAVLDSAEPQGRRPNLALVDRQQGSILAQLELPKDVTGATCATWSFDGSQLLVGLLSGPTPANTARAVLVYQLLEQSLQLSRFLELPLEGRAGAALSSLALHQRGLFGLNLAEGSLVRFDLNSSSLLPAERVFLFPAPKQAQRPIFHLHASLLAADRAENFFLAGEYSDLLSRQVGKRLFQVDLDADHPVLVGDVELPGMVYAMARQPLRDDFWVTHQDAHRLSLLRIDSTGSLLPQSWLAIDPLAPQHIAFDPMGDHMFVSALLK
jgi:hypothetical protein